MTDTGPTDPTSFPVCLTEPDSLTPTLTSHASDGIYCQILTQVTMTRSTAVLRSPYGPGTIGAELTPYLGIPAKPAGFSAHRGVDFLQLEALSLESWAPSPRERAGVSCREVASRQPGHACWLLLIKVNCSSEMCLRKWFCEAIILVSKLTSSEDALKCLFISYCHQQRPEQDKLIPSRTELTSGDQGIGRGSNTAPRATQSEQEPQGQEQRATGGPTLPGSRDDVPQLLRGNTLTRASCGGRAPTAGSRGLNARLQPPADDRDATPSSASERCVHWCMPTS